MKSRKILSIISLILAAVLLLCAGCANEKSLAPATVSTTQTPTEPASMGHLRLLSASTTMLITLNIPATSWAAISVRN